MTYYPMLVFIVGLIMYSNLLRENVIKGGKNDFPNYEVIAEID